MKALSVIIVLCLSVNALASGSVSSSQINEFAKSYPQTKTFNKFVAQNKNNMPEKLVEYFNYKFQKIQSKELPHVKMTDANSLEIDTKNQSITVTFLPNYKIKLNGKVLDLMAAGSFEQQWNLIMNTLPKQQQASLMDLFVNKAYADNLESLNGGLMMATGAMSSVTAGVSMVAEGVTAAALGATGAGLLVMGASYIFWNNGVCTDISKEKVTCMKLKDEMEEKMKGQSQALASMKAQRVPKCGEVDQSAYKETVEALNELVSQNKEMFRAIVTCRQDKKDLNACLEETSLMAYHMCVKTYGATDDYLPAYAKSGAATAPSTSSSSSSSVPSHPGRK